MAGSEGAGIIFSKFALNATQVAYSGDTEKHVLKRRHSLC